MHNRNYIYINSLTIFSSFQKKIFLLFKYLNHTSFVDRNCVCVCVYEQFSSAIEQMKHGGVYSAKYI